jgi:hypothetical protein
LHKKVNEKLRYNDECAEYDIDENYDWPGNFKDEAYEELFIFVRTTTKSIYTQTSVFVLVFPYCCFGFISKAATTKKHQFIYDLMYTMVEP